jgi:DNA-binding transcriptional LysR family regulator
MKLDMTLRQLEVFRTVARARNLTQAAKQLGVAQPSISQQIARLEALAGVALIDRSQTAFRLTEAGEFLLRKAEQVIAGTDEIAAGLGAFRGGGRAVIGVGAPASFSRLVLPAAAALMRAQAPDVELDVHEVSPGEAVDMLYNRQLTVAVIPAGSIESNAMSFPQVEIMADDYVLAAPADLDLSAVVDPARGLPTGAAAVLGALIEFNFGTRHSDRMHEWARRVLPHHRIVARCRSFETALAMVEAGLGVAVVPALSALPAPGAAPRVGLWRTDLGARRLVALTPSQYRGVDPFRSFVQALRDAAATLPPPVGRTAPFLTPAAETAQD